MRAMLWLVGAVMIALGIGERAATLTVHVINSSGPAAGVDISLMTFRDRRCVQLYLKPRAKISVKESQELSDCRQLQQPVHTSSTGDATFDALPAGWYAFEITRYFDVTTTPSDAQVHALVVAAPASADTANYKYSVMYFPGSPLEYRLEALPFEVRDSANIIRVIDLGTQDQALKQ